MSAEHQYFFLDKLLSKAHRRLLALELLLTCVRDVRVSDPDQTALVQTSEGLLHFLARKSSASLELPPVLPLCCHVVVIRVADWHVSMQHFFIAKSCLRLKNESRYSLESPKFSLSP